MKKIWTEFKAFISRGNIVNLAVGVIIGAAFSAIVTSFTNSIIRPVINWILALITGGEGLAGVYTYLKWVPKADDPTLVDLDKSIYIDWGAFITAVIDFFIIAITIFFIMKLLMGAQGYIKKSISEFPTRAERKILKKEGVTMKNRDELIKATAELRERNKPEPKPLPPTQEELLTEILGELKKQNASNEPIAETTAQPETDSAEAIKTIEEPKADKKKAPKKTNK